MLLLRGCAEAFLCLRDIPSANPYPLLSVGTLPSLEDERANAEQASTLMAKEVEEAEARRAQEVSRPTRTFSPPFSPACLKIWRKLLLRRCANAFLCLRWPIR
jgi:hypothetical protein